MLANPNLAGFYRTQHRKARGLDLALRLTIQPHTSPQQIQRTRRNHMLSMRLGKTTIPTLTHTAHTHRLRYRSLNSGDSCILLLKKAGSLVLARRHQCFMLFLRAQRESTRRHRGVRAALTHGTPATDLLAKGDPNGRITMAIMMRNPFRTGMTLGTDRLLGFPVNLELCQIKGLRIFGLPGTITPNRTAQRHPIPGLTREHFLRIGIPSINTMD